MWAEAIVATAARRTDAVIDPKVRFEDDLSPETVAVSLRDFGREVEAIAVITADHPLVSQAIDELRGTDNWKAGRTAAWFISQMAPSSGTVVPFIGSHRYQCQDISDASFRSYMRENAPALQVSDTLLTQEEPERACEIVRKLIADEPELRGIFVNGGGISGVLRALREVDPERQRGIRIVCRDIGPETRKGLGEGLVTAALRHPVDRTPKELIDVMLQSIERRNQPSIAQRIVPFEIVTPESLWT